MIGGALHWLVANIRDRALAVLGIRDDVRMMRRLGPELAELRECRDHFVELTCPRLEVGGACAVDGEADTESLWPGQPVDDDAPTKRFTVGMGGLPWA